MKRSTVNIPFEIVTDEQLHGGISFVDHPHIEGVHYGNHAPAKRALKPKIQEQINDALTCVANHQELSVIPAARAGVVFVVRWLYGGWHYEIWINGKRGSSTAGNWDTFTEACEAAAKHAADYN